ncbi:MAG: EamA family transporter [Proteobacteria bacterium]|nr:EamA family transporter [Pseudomonadota bacterium]
MALIASSAAAVAALALPFAPAPASASWPYIGASLALHTGYKLFLIGAYRHGDLGHVYPLARGTAPLLVLAAGALVVGEVPEPGGIAAVLVVGLGVVSLAFRGGAPVAEDPRPLLFALGTAGFIASYTLVDGLGARLAGSPHGYAVWFFLLDGIPISAIALAARREAVLGIVRRHGLAGLGGGAMSFGAYWLVIWALTLGPMAPVAALRETSVVIAAAIGTLLLKERFGVWRIAASAAVALGLVLLRL